MSSRGGPIIRTLFIIIVCSIATYAPADEPIEAHNKMEFLFKLPKNFADQVSLPEQIKGTLQFDVEAKVVSQIPLRSQYDAHINLLATDLTGSLTLAKIDMNTSGKCDGNAQAAENLFFNDLGNLIALTKQSQSLTASQTIPTTSSPTYEFNATIDLSNLRIPGMSPSTEPSTRASAPDNWAPTSPSWMVEPALPPNVHDAFQKILANPLTDPIAGATRPSTRP